LLIKSYPNPTSGEITILAESIRKEDMYIRITNLVGQSVYTDQLLQTTVYSKVLDLRGFPNGMYIMQVLTPEKSYSQRIILQK